MITVHGLSPNVAVRAGDESPPLSPELDAEVAALWRVEREGRGPWLFDGRVFSIASLSETRIEGRFVPYRRLIAQRAKPALFAALRVRPLAVSGLLACADGVVFGRRAATLTDDAGRWELVPSGGVGPESADPAGRVDIGRQLSVELQEELGLGPESIRAAEPFCALEDGESHGVDIGFAIATALSGNEVRASHAGRGSAEYSALAVVAVAEIPGFVAALGDELIGVSRALLLHKGLLAR